MNLHIPAVRTSHSLLFAVAAIALMKTSSAFAQTGAGSITLDRSTYAAGQKGTIQIDLPEPLIYETVFYLSIKETGGAETEWSPQDCGGTFSQKSQSCIWRAPDRAGNYEMYLMYVTADHGRESLAAAKFRVVGDAADVPAAPEPAGGRMRLRTAKPFFVYGERMLVELTMPPSKDGEEQSGRLSWSEAAATRADTAKAAEIPQSKGADVSHTFKGGKFVVSVYAPWSTPGRYSLRLFQKERLIDMLVVAVSKGWVDDGIVPDKTIFAPGEAITMSLNLPGDRYYSGGGPFVLLYPLELEGRRLTRDESIKLAGQYCPKGYCLGRIDWNITAPRDKPDRGYGTSPFGCCWPVTPGKYVLDKAIGSYLPWAAPTPGRYELRLYDEWPTDPFVGWVGRNFAAHEIVVGSPQISLRFMAANGKALVGADAAIAQEDEFYLEVEYQSPPKDCAQTITIDAGANSTEQIPLSRSEKNPRVCRSEYIRVEKPGL